MQGNVVSFRCSDTLMYADNFFLKSSRSDLQRPEPTSFNVGGVNVTLYAFDARVDERDTLQVLYTAWRDVQDAPASPTMGSEVKSYREGTVSLVLIPTEALAPSSWQLAVERMTTHGVRVGSWGFSFQICDERSGNEVGSGRLKGVQLSPPLVLSNDT